MKRSFFPISLISDFPPGRRPQWAGGRIPTSEFNLFRIPTFLTLLLLLIIIQPMRFAAGTDSQNLGTLTANLDRTSVPVGGVVWLTLEYQLPPGGRLPEKPEIKGLDEISILNRIIEPGQIRIQLLVDRMGPWQSNPISLTYLDEQGDTRLLKTSPISIQAVSNLGEKADEAQLRPIREIVPVKSIWQSYLMWLAAIVILILIGLSLYWWYRRRRKPAGQPEYREPPDIQARRELRELETQRYFENGRVKKYYFAFSEILRRYLESIRKFPAAEFTTEEIARHIRNKKDHKLIPLLQQADMVKFADTVPTAARKEEDIRAALAYIRETSPKFESVMEHADRREAQR